MTATEMLALAREALDKIKTQDGRMVRAARKGICAAAILNDHRIAIFRRVDGRERMEVWPDLRFQRYSDRVQMALPPDLAKEAGEMLDALPATP